MLTHLRRPFLAGEIPSGHGSVFHFLDIFALGFGLAAVDSLVAGRSLWVVGGCVIAAIAIHILGTKWPLIRERLGPRLATILYRAIRVASALLIGIVVVSIFLYVHQLRSDLDNYVMPRSVTKQQADQISQVLAGHDPGISLDVFASVADPEATEYAAQLMNAIKKGGWDARLGVLNPWETGALANHNNGTFYNIYLAMDRDVTIRVGLVGQPKNPDPRHPDPDALLREAFQKAGINAGGAGSADRGQYSLT